MKRVIALLLAVMMLFSLTACGEGEKESGEDTAAQDNTTWTSSHFSISFPKSFEITYEAPDSDDGVILYVVDNDNAETQPYFSVTKFKTADTPLRDVREIDEEFGMSICNASLSAVAAQLGLEESQMQPTLEGVSYHKYGQLEGAKVDFNFLVTFTQEDVEYTNVMYCSYITIIDNYYTYALSFVSIADTIDYNFADVINSIECLD
ncbi:MAG: hypothetical protein IJP17_05145 [Clostridia bacterium]|nr:hypothetical protein [Clostridia bacterium]